jgi:uncharacterized protein (DUF4213/DUF364 family)
MILEKTVELIKQIYEDEQISLPKVSTIVIGLGYTGVEVSIPEYKTSLGLASTLSRVITSFDCSKIEFAGTLTKKPLLELLDWSYKPPGLKKIIGIAALNATSQYILRIKNSYAKLPDNLIEHLNINQTTKLTVIGFMKPLIRELSRITENITLIEDTYSVSSEFSKYNFRTTINDLENDETSTDFLFCTGTVFINNSIERILDKFHEKAKKIIIIGPSASMIPDILFQNNVDIVGGMEIFDTKATLQVLQEGGGTKIFKQYGKKYNLIKK